MSLPCCVMKQFISLIPPDMKAEQVLVDNIPRCKCIAVNANQTCSISSVLLQIAVMTPLLLRPIISGCLDRIRLVGPGGVLVVCLLQFYNLQFITTTTTTATTDYNTNWWFHPQISLGYSRRVETIITKITNNTKNNYNLSLYILYVTKLPNTALFVSVCMAPGCGLLHMNNAGL